MLLSPYGKAASPWLGAVFWMASCTPAPPPLTPHPSDLEFTDTSPLPPEVARKIWRVSADSLVDGDGAQVTLRGIAFGNEVWDHVAVPSAHHSFRDFLQVANMNMNSVRFYLTYHTFEDDSKPGKYKQSGWDWLDQNVHWASDAGVRLILNMHDPVGGYQSQGGGNSLWTDEKAQDRFVALWKEIAHRYRAEPTIVGYDLLNEPAPTSRIHQWQRLAERTISAIREVDQVHPIFVERVNSVAGDWAENENSNFFRVADPNVVYEFHFYKPYHFTHQNAAWSDFAAREAWYPDEQAVAVDWFRLKAEARAESPALVSGESSWTLLETEPYQVTSPNLVVGKPVLVCDRAGGRATFDSLSLTKIGPLEEPDLEHAESAFQQEIEPEVLFEQDLDTRRGWFFWSENESGFAQFDPRGHGDSTAIVVEGTTAGAQLLADPLRFFLEEGATYQLQGLARGTGLSKSANCRLRLEFYSSSVPVWPRGKEFLEQEVASYLAWGKREGVPVYLGEFGTIRDSFIGDRGGLRWVGDMLDLLLENEVHFAYHAYHEVNFGLYAAQGALPRPSDLNLPLFELFRKKLDTSSKVAQKATP